jgi:glycosyltransferase involved in cell wall biosynthesis
MKVIKVAQIIDSLSWGGAQRMQILLAKALIDRPVELVVLSLRSSDNAPFAKQIETLGIKVYVLPAPKLFYYRRLSEIKNILVAEQVDLVHAHLTYANIVGAVVARWLRIPVITTLRTSGVDHDFYNPLRFRLETWVLQHLATKIMANGYSVADVHLQRLRNRTIEVIPNAIEIPGPITDAERTQIRHEIIRDSKRPWIISVGRLANPKGFIDLINAFHIVHLAHPTAFLTIVGSGGLAEDLQTQIHSLDLDAHVKLTGERSDVFDLLRSSNIFVSSSHWEGMSVAVLEAMASGLPIVATAVGDAPKVVVPGTGIVVPPRRPEKIAQAIIEILANPNKQKQMGEHAQSHIASNYNLGSFGDQLIDLYSRILKSQTQRERPTNLLPEKIHVAMVIQDYLPVGGGAERQIASLAPFLHRNGVKISILTRRYPGMIKFERINAVPVHRLPSLGPKPIASLTFTISAIVKLFKLRPDILHSHGLLSPATIAIAAKKVLKIPIVAKILRGGKVGDLDRIENKPFTRLRSTGIRRNIDRFISISSEIEAELSQFGIPAEKLVQIPNGVDTFKFTPLIAIEKISLRQSLNLLSGPIVIYTGRLAPEKNIDQLINVWNNIQAQFPQAQLLILGTGELEKDLRRMAMPSIRFIGYTDNVATYLQAADIFVLPSQTEGLANSLLEAMATGLAVIATSVGGAPDVIAHEKNGWLIEPNQPAALNNALLQLLADSTLRENFGQRARQTILLNFNLPVIATKLHDLYSQLHTIK